MKKPSSQEIEITLDDIEIIMGNGYEFFPRIVGNCFCSWCEDHITTITNYKAYLNNLQDIILKGECSRCGKPVGRYIETGDSIESAGVAKHVREIIKKYRKG
jgi:hypothetical protein